MTCKSEAADAFIASPLRNLFTDFDANAQAHIDVVEMVADYICCTYDGEAFYRNCPLKFDCYARLMIAYILDTWGFRFGAVTEEAPDGTWGVKDPASDFTKYVQTDTVGEVTRTYDWPPEYIACKDCSETLRAQWRAEIDKLVAACQNASKPTIWGATNFHLSRATHGGCCGCDFPVPWR